MRRAWVTAMLLAWPTSGFAAEPAVEPASGFFNEAHRQQLYDQTKKSEWTAIGYSLAFPGLGNFYAEQYVTGTVVGMGMVFGITALVFGQTTDQSEWTWLGLGLGGSMYVVGATTSYFGVVDYNHELRRALKVSELERAPGLQLSLSF